VHQGRGWGAGRGDDPSHRLGCRAWTDPLPWGQAQAWPALRQAWEFSRHHSHLLSSQLGVLPPQDLSALPLL
jgi:hypothetical protein